MRGLRRSRERSISISERSTFAFHSTFAFQR
jgi:hypothetical protein